MKRGDKVICIENKYGDSFTKLTIGREYEIINNSVDWEIIHIFDSTSYEWFPTKLFITQQQHRENQLNQIGIC